MNQQSTLEQLQELKLSGMAKRYEAILNQPVHQQPEPHALIALLAEAESGYRAYQRTQLYLRLSKLRYNATPEQINCTPGRGITKEVLAMLTDGTFIEKSENILITGPPDVEKVIWPVLWAGMPACWDTGHSIIL